MADVRVQNLTKRFDDVVAVKNLSLECKDREFMVFLGPSGCGKTTTLRSIAGLEHPDEGDIYIDNNQVNDLPPADRDVAFVFQFYALYPHMTVYDNMAFPLKAVKMPKPEIEQRIKEVSAVLRIERLLNRTPSKLSGGEMQRVALGRAMVRRPKVFLMDEPLTNLDAKLRSEMRAELKRLQKDIGATTIYVTHDQLEAMSMGDKIAVMNQGVAQQIGTPGEVYDHPASLFVASFVGSPAMNLLDCEYRQEDGKSVLIVGENDFILTISDELGKKIQDDATDSNLILGIRAEDVFVRDEAAEDTVQAEVYVVEPLGSENIIDLRIGENMLKVKTLPTVQPDIGQTIDMWLDKNRMHLFDKTTEKAIS
ncbi:sn-glycerol-3-phosphate ABC transporter ATP-binding protein UgpC [Candidatus Poribacteria bacterium]|nr:sn-glycerol-3-phosphate ABC transporter ATP-binding protein UgpC [Candidatus Poribacteria bacterium]